MRRMTVIFLSCLLSGIAFADFGRDLVEARKLFESNLDAIRRRDRDAYLAGYLDAETFARTGPEGPQRGFAAHAEQSKKDPWPEVFEGHDLQLVPIRAGVVYGTYRYRVRYGAGDEHLGISERIFLETKKGWKIAVTTAFEASKDTPPPPVALAGETLLDGTGGAAVADAVIVMRGGKIDCAGSRSACPIPEGLETVDLTGLFVTPGLVDAHVHFSQTGWADGRPDSIDLREQFPYEQLQAKLRGDPGRFLRSYVCSGVTSVFDVGGYPWTWDLRARAEADTASPHVAAAGPLLTTLDHWLNLPAERQFIYLADPNAAREGVRYLSAHATSAVKVWFIDNTARGFDEMAGAVRAAGEEARARHLPLIVHATGLKEAKASLGAGANLLVHSVWDLPLDDEFIDLAKRNGTIYCPTLTVIDGYYRMYQSVLSGNPPPVDDPGQCVDAETLDHVASTPKAAAGKVDAAALARFANREAMRDTMAANLRRVRDAGIPIAMGTDAGNPLTLHGPSVFGEMEAMEAAGMTPAEVLRASTLGGATAMGRAKDLGTVEAGKAADLLVVAADPLVTVRNLRQMRYVVRGGVMRRGTELRARRP
ncbi:MAG: amidohydrolase family protein [Acidobacteria bacterium]|nr:amidohydrolase family protein [Acidobacteriota bacterium]